MSAYRAAWLSIHCGPASYLKTGRSPSVRQSGIYHRAAASWLHERYRPGNATFAYASSEGIAAGTFTMASNRAPAREMHVHVSIGLPQLKTLCDPCAQTPRACSCAGTVANATSRAPLVPAAHCEKSQKLSMAACSLAVVFVLGIHWARTTRIVCRRPSALLTP